MKLRNLVLGGALIALPVPAFAHYAGNPPQYSTPAEKAETRALNRNAADGTYVSPAVLNGKIPVEDAGPDRWQRYEARMARYERTRQELDAQHEAYLRAMARWRAVHAQWLEEQSR